MIFFRAPDRSTKGLSIKAVRGFLSISLAAYPVGGAIATLDFPAARIIGLLVIAGSLAAAVPVLGSHFQKIVGEQVHLLDEFELKLRQRAMSAAYAAFTGFTLLAIIYANLARDYGWWVPTDFDGYSGLFWGVFLYASLLPTFFLVWDRQSASELADSDGE